MRIGLIGCVKSSEMALKTLLETPNAQVCAVVTRKDSKVNSDFCDLSPICRSANIPFHYEDPQQRDLSTDFLKSKNVDVIFCIGWSYLIDEKLFNFPRYGVIGFHPAKLPQNRGRHPIIWSIALNLEETASTFFRIDKGVDSGPIVDQKTIVIEPNENAKTLYEKILNVAKSQISEITTQLIEGEIKYTEQDHSKATYWRKRSRKDGLIDFRMSAESIDCLVRALTTPYPCAEVIHNSNYFKVPSTSVSQSAHSRNIEPGKVLEVKNSSILVKTNGSGAIFLHGVEKNDIRVGDYL